MILILAVSNSLNLHIFEFSQFRPDLIAPIKSGLGLAKSAGFCSPGQNSGLWSLSQKVFTDFTSVLLHMLIASTFSGVLNMGLRHVRGPMLGPFKQSGTKTNLVAKILATKFWLPNLVSFLLYI